MTRPQFSRRAHQVVGGELTPAQHHALARLMRLPEHSAAAARRVLVDGDRPGDAAAAEGVSASSLARTVGRMRTAHELVRGAYSPPERPKRPEATTHLPPR